MSVRAGRSRVDHRFADARGAREGAIAVSCEHLDGVAGGGRAVARCDVELAVVIEIGDRGPVGLGYGPVARGAPKEQSLLPNSTITLLLAIVARMDIEVAIAVEAASTIGS